MKEIILIRMHESRGREIDRETPIQSVIELPSSEDSTRTSLIMAGTGTAIAVWQKIEELRNAFKMLK